MNVYVWDYLKRMSDSYHDDGGVVVVAESVEKARELLRTKDEHGYTPVPGDSDVFDREPEVTYPTAGEVAARVFTFPNAGCC